MRKFLILLSAVLLVLTGSVLSLNAAETRTWNDSSGLFSVEASLVGIDGKKVKLKKSDGKVVSLPLAKLSEEDQKYISDLAAANPFEGGEESGDEKASRRPSRRPAKPGETGSAAEAKKLAKFPLPKPVDLEKVPEAGGAAENSWSCPPDPAPLKTYSQKVKNLSFSNRGLPEKAHPSHREFFVNPGTGQTVIASFEAKSIGSRKDAANHLTRIFLGDAFAGTTVYFDSPLLLKPFGLSPDGKKALFSQDSWEFSDKERKRELHILKVSPGLLEPLVSYEPFSYWKQDNERHLPATEIQWADWVDDDHVLVLSRAGWLILLKTDSGKAVWKFKTDAHSNVSLSPGGKYCLVPKGSDVFLLETTAGTPVGRLGGLPDNAFVMRFGFSPDGEHIAACSENGAMIWNATDGKYQEPFYVKGSFLGQSTVWVDSRYFLLGSRLIDSKKQTQVWNYIGINRNLKTAGEYSWCFFSRYGDDSFLVPFVLPHQEMDQSGETTFAVDSGTGIALVLDPSVVDDREKIQDNLKKKFEANGWVLAEDAPISVVLKVEEEKPKTTEYVTGSPFRLSPIFRGGGTEIEFKPMKYSIAVQKGDEMLWGQYYITTPPQHVSLDQIKDTSLQEIVKESLEEQKYQKWFEETEFPKKITLPPDRNKASLVSEKGIDDAAAKFVPDDRQQQGGLRPMKGQHARDPYGFP